MNQIDENKRLIERYPFLALYDRTGKPLDGYDYTWLDDMPDGWRTAFGEQMCEEIKDELLKFSYEDNTWLNHYRIVQIKEKYGCYDKETEILTKNGWKYFKDLSKEDLIATLEGEELKYENPTDIISYHYSGEMYKLQFRGIDLLVTPNHNLYVAKGSYWNSKTKTKRLYDFELCTPDKYLGKDKRFKKGAKWIGQEPNNIFTIPGYSYTNFMKLNNCMRTYKQDDLNFEIVPFLRFLGFYIAEGCTRNGEIMLAYNRYDEEELVETLLNDLNIKDLAKINTDFERGLKRFSTKTLAVWLDEHCGHGAINKKVPDFIKDLPPKYIEEFLTYLYIGDGHKTKTYNILTTTSKQLSDDVQELLLKAGYTFRERRREPRSDLKHLVKGRNIIGKHLVYEVNWLKLTDVEIDNSKMKHTKSFIEEFVPYNDEVYCVTVPSHIIYIRRNGKGCWCGNSLRWYDNGYPSGSKIPDIISKYETISETTCITCGKPAQYLSTGWISPYCRECAQEIVDGLNQAHGVQGTVESEFVKLGDFDEN